MPGEVSVGDKSCRMTCQIVDMSATGARLHLNQPNGRTTINGDRIALYFDKQCTCVECRIVWLAGNQLGVQFRSAFHRCGRNPLPIAKGH